LAAVGNGLPTSFFSYGQAPITDPRQQQAVMARISNIPMPSSAEIVSKAPPSYLVRRGHFAYSHQPVINQRRQAQFAPSDSSQDGFHPNEVQASFVKGYLHGFSTAKTFALNDFSKLGFVRQYLADNLAKLGPDVIKPGTEQSYIDGFEDGLLDGETAIASAFNNSS
jgi:glucan 1,3-beta-glucosidase